MDGELLLEIVVMGKPEPQGSSQAFVPLHPQTKQPYRREGGGVVVNVTSDNPELKKWRATVAESARKAFGFGKLVEGESLGVEVVSYLKRREGDWGTGRNAHLLKDHAEADPLVKPDVDKLLRAVLDALTDVIYKDDNLVTKAVTEKRYAVPDARGVPVRAEVRVYRREAQTGEHLPMGERVRVLADRPTPPDEVQAALAL